MKIFIAMDIGCLECGEGSACLGVYKDRDEAQRALAAAEKTQAETWTGEHSFEIFEQEVKIRSRRSFKVRKSATRAA